MLSWNTHVEVFSRVDEAFGRHHGEQVDGREGVDHIGKADEVCGKCDVQIGFELGNDLKACKTHACHRNVKEEKKRHETNSLETHKGRAA